MFSVTSAITCMHQNESDEEVKKECSSKKHACSVLWTGPTAKEAVITSKACWSDYSTYQTCSFGPCTPQELEVAADQVVYFCCCKGDLCNKIPEQISYTTTDPPKCKHCFTSYIIFLSFLPQLFCPMIT